MITFSSQLWIAPPPLELGIVCVLFWKIQFSISCPPPCQIKIAPPPRSEVDLLFKKVQFLMI